MKLIAVKSMGRLRPGDEFEVNRTQARALKALGKAKDAEAIAAAPAMPARTLPVAEPAEPKPERAVPRYERYRRRDMVPEES